MQFMQKSSKLLILHLHWNMPFIVNSRTAFIIFSNYPIAVQSAIYCQRKEDRRAIFERIHFPLIVRKTHGTLF